jgi:hypothetical protein
MKRTVFLLAMILFCSTFKLSGQTCGGCSTSISGNDTLTYNVESGQMLCIANSGNFLGKITISGGTVCITGNFNPQSITITSGVINNNGNATINSSVTFGSSFLLHNNSGAILNISGNLTLSSSAITNDGIINVVNDIANSGSITNSNIINCVQITGSGSLTNTGIINSN